MAKTLKQLTEEGKKLKGRQFRLESGGYYTFKQYGEGDLIVDQYGPDGRLFCKNVPMDPRLHEKDKEIERPFILLRPFYVIGNILLKMFPPEWKDYEK